MVLVLGGWGGFLGVFWSLGFGGEGGCLECFWGLSIQEKQQTVLGGGSHVYTLTRGSDEEEEDNEDEADDAHDCDFLSSLWKTNEVKEDSTSVMRTNLLG